MNVNTHIATKQAEFVATIWLSNIPTEIHFIQMPKAGEKDYALCSASMNVFLTTELRKLTRSRQQKELNHESGVLYKRASVERLYEYQFRLETRKNVQCHSGFTHKLREFYHTSLWEFYRAVDYDHVNKRWIC